jgi:glycosyltransferase involved in cell wall biosynthesis
VHVVPSREEAWSQSAVVAMGLGVPVVGTAVEELPLTLGEGRGLLVAPDNPRALAAATAAIVRGGERTDVDGGRSYAARFEAGLVAEGYARRLPPSDPRTLVSATTSQPRRSFRQTDDGVPDHDHPPSAP